MAGGTRVSRPLAALAVASMAALGACAGVGPADQQPAWVARGERDGRVTLTEASYEPPGGARAPGAAPGRQEAPSALMQAVEALLGGVPAAQPPPGAPEPQSRRPARQVPQRASAQPTPAGSPSPDRAEREAQRERLPAVATAPRVRVVSEALPSIPALRPGDPVPPPQPSVATGRSRIFSLESKPAGS